MTTQRTLATVLFTDIVGSTERAAKLGDRGWRELLARHDAMVRRRLRRHAGIEINTAGDGFVARFDDPARAIICAWEIREGLRELDLAIRAGLHMGQVEGGGREAVGIAVHVGARVAAAAEPGEILVSRTVHDAVEGGGLGFEDRGAHDLKGVPGDRRLFRVEHVPPERLEAAPRWRERFDARFTQRTLYAVAAVAVAVLLVGLYAFLRNDPVSPGPTEAEAAGAAPGVAVLPFTIQGAGLDIWREGMVDVLSTNLDGAAGLRAIDARTVLARWREAVPAGGSADLARALDVARRAGARYALLGSVVASGVDMRLVADLYDVPSGEALGQAQVEGSPDSIFALVDRLSIEILQAVLEEPGGGLPEIRLARVTTESVEALKTFLQGEVDFRHGDFAAAADAYRLALGSDSTFALAAYRLGQSYAWMEGPGGLALEAYGRAKRHVDRLPEREANLARGLGALGEGSLDGLPILRRAVTTHPDDPEAWYLLGETYFHLGDQALVPAGEADRAFARAIALDPQFAPAYIHRIHAAFRYDPDSARAAQLIGRYARLAGGSEVHREAMTGFALAFGDSAAKTRAWAALDTSSFLLPSFAFEHLSHARFLPARSRVLKLALERPGNVRGTGPITELVTTLLHRGHLTEALEVLDGSALEGTSGELLYEIRLRGFPVSEPNVEAARSSEPFPLLYAGALAAERGRWREHSEILTRMRALAADAEQAGDSTKMRLVEGSVRALEGVEAWRRGRLGEARRSLDESRLSITGHFEPGRINQTIRWWTAEVLIESGELKEAIPYLASLADGSPFEIDPVAAYRLGQIHERLGNVREGRRWYGFFLAAWRDPDPSLRARTEEARQAVIRLTGPRRG